MKLLVALHAKVVHTFFCQRRACDTTKFLSSVERETTEPSLRLHTITC